MSASNANMQGMQEYKSSGTTGLRERKRAETHGRIQTEAMRLFLAQGFDAITLDDIAEAAGVSRRSLFHYFGSKEDIVFSTKAGFPEMIRAAIAARPADEPLMLMVENALADMSVRHTTTESRALALLIRDTPALRAGDQAKYDAVERVMADALAERAGLPKGDVTCRVAASTAIGILKLSVEAWLAADGDQPPEAFGRDAFAALRRLTT